MDNKRPLIALITNNDDDVYCFRKELIEAINESGYEVLISCPYGPKFEIFDVNQYIYDNPEIDRRGTNPINDLKLIKLYFSLLNKYNPSVILTYTAKPNIYAGFVASILNIPFISNVTGFGSLMNDNGLKQKLVMAMYKTTLRKAHTVMFQNSSNMQLAEKTGMVKGHHRLIPGSGVNTNRYPALSYPDGGNGIEGKPVVFNYIGRILHDKGVDDYIEAAKQIKKDYPSTQFNMLGFIEPTENHYEKELSDLGKSGIVNYLGSQQDIKPFVAASHATIHPSVYGEGMSNVLLESASCARRLITTDNAGCKETVVDKETGFVYHGGNVEELICTIKHFLSLPNDEREAMGQRSREFIKNNFSRDIVIKNYLEVIRLITGE